MARPSSGFGSVRMQNTTNSSERCESSRRTTASSRRPAAAADAWPCVPDLARNARGARPCARYQRSRRRGAGQGPHRAVGSAGRPIQRGGATPRNRRRGVGPPGTSGHVTVPSSRRGGVCGLHPASTPRQGGVVRREVGMGSRSQVWRKSRGTAGQPGGPREHTPAPAALTRSERGEIPADRHADGSRGPPRHAVGVRKAPTVGRRVRWMLDRGHAPGPPRRWEHGDRTRRLAKSGWWRAGRSARPCGACSGAAAVRAATGGAWRRCRGLCRSPGRGDVRACSPGRSGRVRGRGGRSRSRAAGDATAAFRRYSTGSCRRRCCRG
jgi:hypothetical protein